VVGLTASAGFCGWLELALLRNSLKEKIGKTGLPSSFISKLCLAAVAGAAAGWAGKWMMDLSHPIPLAIVSLGLYGTVYLGLAVAFRVPEARGLISKAGSFVGLHW
jgi:peptidoglycan biosynthesis protein MviN/MurJ (putative lipid II flippase)